MTCLHHAIMLVQFLVVVDLELVKFVYYVSLTEVARIKN